MDIVIFEDEQDNAERLVYLLGKCQVSVTSIQLLESVAAGVDWFRTDGVADLLFMDIKLADGHCFEIFEQVECRIPIIFTTAYDSFALKAFKFHSVDYLLKPIDLLELQRSFAKLNQFHTAAESQRQIARVVETFLSRREARFIGKINNQLVYIKENDIAFIAIKHGIVWATDRNNRTVPIDNTLDEAEKLLDSLAFFRINRKVIVNIDAIAKITTYSNSRLEIRLTPDHDENHIVSRERVGLFKKWLAGKP